MPIPADRPRLGRTLLRDDAYTRLHEAIIDGTLAPGEQLKDNELAEWLGVSRTPIREALLRLARSGLVIARPGRSTIVSPVDLRSVREARDVVAAMHRLAVQEAVPRMTAGDIAAMREANRRFEAAIVAGDVEDAIDIDDELHGIPVAVSGNRAIAAVLDQFGPVLVRAVRLRFASPGGWSSLSRHDELIELCDAGDADRAAAIAFDIWHGLFAEDAPVG